MDYTKTRNEIKSRINQSSVVGVGISTGISLKLNVKAGCMLQRSVKLIFDGDGIIKFRTRFELYGSTLNTKVR